MSAAGLDRALAFLRGTAAGLADEVRQLDVGVAVRSHNLPCVWGLNQVRIDAPVLLERALELADLHLGDLDFRHLHVEHEASGAMLAGDLRDAGWKYERELIMVLTRTSDRAPDPGVEVFEPSEEEMLTLMRAWHREEASVAEHAMAQVIEYARREGRLYGDRNLGVRGASGELLAMTKLRTDGVIAQVEDVYTAPAARGRGYARALVTRAVELARSVQPELIFIVADDQDWPKHLYGRIGFEPVGRTHTFHLDLPATPDRLRG